MDSDVEGSSFCDNFVSSLSTKLENVNVGIGASFFRSPNWLRYKNAIINPEKNDDRYCISTSTYLCISTYSRFIKK